MVEFRRYFYRCCGKSIDVCLGFYGTQMSYRTSIITEEKEMKYMNELKSSLFWKSTLAEFISTTLYSYIANSLCGSSTESIYLNSDCAKARNSSGLLLAATGIGLTVATLSYIFKMQYGCYMNPAVSFGQFTCWRLSFTKTFILLLMQMCGGIAGVAISYLVSNKHHQTYLGISYKDMTSAEGVIGQLIPSFIIVMVVLHSSDEKRNEKESVSSLLYGLASTVAVLIAAQHSECAINPARILGLAIISNRWSQPIWVYWVGSISGGITAGVVYQLISSTRGSQESKHSRPPFFKTSKRPSWEKSIPTVPRSNKNSSSFWKKQEQSIPFIKVDTSSENTVV